MIFQRNQSNKRFFNRLLTSILLLFISFYWDKLLLFAVNSLIYLVSDDYLFIDVILDILEADLSSNGVSKVVLCLSPHFFFLISVITSE